MRNTETIGSDMGVYYAGHNQSTVVYFHPCLDFSAREGQCPLSDISRVREGKRERVRQRVWRIMIIPLAQLIDASDEQCEWR